MTDPVDKHLERVFKRLDGRRLGTSDASFSDADLALGPLGDRNDLLFGVYTAEGLTNALRAYGTLGRLKRRVGRLTLELELEDPYLPRLLAYPAGESRERPVIDISLSLRTAGALGLEPAADAKLLYLESIVLQRPAEDFTWERPPLPHQNFPGLNLSGEILQLLVLMARRLGTEGLALTPKSATSAAIFSRFFRFVDPKAGARMRAFRHAMRAFPFWYVAWAAEQGCLRDAAGAQLTFSPSIMLVPLSDRMRDLIPVRPTKALSTRALSVLTPNPIVFTVDDACLRRRFPWDKMPSDPPPPEVVALVGERPGTSAADSATRNRAPPD